MIKIGTVKYYFFLALIFWGTCYAQVPQNFSFHFITNESQTNGLSQTSNHFIFKDSRGFVWISSMAGLNRYDGKNVKIYEEILSDSTSLYGQFVQGVFSEDSETDLWFSTYKSLHRYNRKNDNFSHFYLKDSLGNPIPGFFTCGIDDEDRVWLIYQDYLYIFNTKSEEFTRICYLAENIYRGVVQKDKNGSVKTFYAYSPGKSDLLKISVSELEAIEQRTIHLKDVGNISTILPAEDSLLWITSNNGLIRLNPFSEEKRLFDEMEGEKINKLVGTVRLSNEFLIVSSTEKGLLLFNKNDLKFSQPKLPHETNQNAIYSKGPIHLLADSSLWFSIEGLGVAYTYPNEIKFENLLSKRSKNRAENQFSINSIIEAGNREIWVATYSNGILVFDDSYRIIRRITYEDYPQLNSNLIIQLFKDQKNRIWILTWRGLSYYDINKDRFYSITNDHIFTFGLQLKNGKIILCSQSKSGIWELNSDFSIEKITLNDSSKYTYLFEDKDSSIFASRDLTYLVEFAQDSVLNERTKIPVNGNFKGAYEPLVNNSFIWFATTNGLIKLYKEQKEIDVFSRKDGLPSSTLYSIIPDREGYLWISTNSGISCFNPNNQEFQNYGLKEGISALEFNTFSYLKKSENEIWLGSTDGITIFDPLNINSTKTPNIEIIEIMVNDELDGNLRCQITGALNPEEIIKLVLPYEENTLSFSFVALEFAHQENVRIRYKIEGIDQDWINSRSDGFIRYSNIQPGNYSLKVKSSTSIGNWSNPKVLKFQILTPFYKTWWFSLACFILILLFVYSLFYFHQRRKEKLSQALEDQRNKFAQDMHDEIGSSISSIKLSLEYLLVKLPENDFKTKLNVVNKSTQNLYQKIREVIWSINSRNDNLETLISYLHRYGLESFENSNIKCSIHIPELVPEKIVVGVHRSNILFSYKEAINNILVHSDASFVAIKFSIFKDLLKITIQDNGRGIPDKALVNSRGNGLYNMEHRLRSIGGTFEIKSSEFGTTLIFTSSLDTSTKVGFFDLG